ncbi:hypothetical protein ACERII_24560 [Evansella sp. AB-rgal1]|uniref:hypothetical protein n=1 Tax=Evansella sp. AB-rgal1 TaxID=3242696 RepID=UPI00359E7D68
MEIKQINLIQHLKSVAIMLHPNETGDDYQLNSTKLMNWLHQYDNWFKESVGITEGERPYTLYNRQVSLFGEGLLSLPKKFEELAESIINMGYAVSLTVDIVELFNDFNEVKSLCDKSLISSLGVITDQIDYLEEHISINDFMKELVALKRPIGLIGSVSALRNHNLLSLTSLNGTDITIYPPPGITGNNSPTAHVNPISPCANRLQLYIDQDGHIYPCMGLLGITDYALGHVTDNINETAILGKEYKLDLEQLMIEGPKLTNSIKPQQMNTNLPRVCELHREELLVNV